MVIAVQNKCYKSVHVLNSKDSRFTFELADSYGISLIGHKFISLLSYDDGTSDSMINQNEKTDDLKE